MSIISSNRHGRRPSRAHDYVDASMTAARNEPRKRELRAMLADAVRNTAALPIEPGAGGHPVPIASAPNPTPGPGADASLLRGEA